MISTKTISLAILSTGILIAGTVLFTDTVTPKKTSSIPPISNTFIQGGLQMIEITAKGGFTPQKTFAKAGVPTTLRIITKGTFDCSSSVSIPELNVVKSLPSTGRTEFNLGIHEPGILTGSCGMGMYPFVIEFQR